MGVQADGEVHDQVHHDHLADADEQCRPVRGEDHSQRAESVCDGPVLERLEQHPGDDAAHEQREGQEERCKTGTERACPVLVRLL